MILHLISALKKKILYKKSQYFPKPYDRFGGNVKVELDLSNYGTQTDLKGATGIDTSNLKVSKHKNILEKGYHTN